MQQTFFLPARYVIWATLVCWGLAAGCVGASPPSDVAVHAADEAAIAQIPLTALLDSLQHMPHRSACDRQMAQEQLRVAARLEAEPAAAPVPPTQYSKETPSPVVPFGPIRLIETGYGAEPLPVPPGAAGKRRIARGWADVFRLVDDLDLPAQEPEDRAELLQSALGLAYELVIEDSQRLGGRSMGIDDASFELLRGLQAQLERCVADGACTLPALSAQAKRFCRQENPAYARYLTTIEQAKHRITQRRALREWIAQVNLDLSYSAFRPNEDISLVNGELIVPVQAGDFEAVKEGLAATIEKVWRNPQRGVGVRLLWTDATQHPEAYRFVVGQSVDGRDHVDPLRRQIALHDCTTQRAIAHEFGHVLGLPDHYFTHWDESNCQYELRFDSNDIMSNHMTGVVTDAEWEDIIEGYWAAEG